ncbi:MAG: type II toxin-antitoxin system VapC family toxin [Actinobacteria bacterium]|nr:type II toxin-antitoxin system VapC family toxin [Actinomycetota bacterium]
MTAYVDASVLLRFVLGQPDRLEALRRIHSRVTSLLAQVECLRVIDALRIGNDLSEEEYAAKRLEVFTQVRRMERVTVSRSVLDSAAAPLPVRLKTLDAIHLATAVQWRQRRASALVFATHDRQLGRAAAALGFPVIGV